MNLEQIHDGLLLSLDVPTKTEDVTDGASSTLQWWFYRDCPPACPPAITRDDRDEVCTDEVVSSVFQE